MKVTQPSIGFLDGLSNDVRFEIFGHALTTYARSRRASKGENRFVQCILYDCDSDLTQDRKFQNLLAANKTIQVEKVELLFRKNQFLLTVAEIKNLINAASLSKASTAEATKNGPKPSEASKLDLIKDLISYIDFHSNSPSGSQSGRRSLTILANHIDLNQISRLSSRKDLTKGVRVFSKDVGLWTVSLGPYFEIKILHTGLRNAWNKLRVDPTLNLRTVTRDICAQADEAKPDGKKLSELYLLRAALALRLWMQHKKQPNRDKRMSWYAMTAVSFVDVYAAGTNYGRFVDMGTPILGPNCNEDALSWANSILLQVVSPFPGMLR